MASSSTSVSAWHFGTRRLGGALLVAAGMGALGFLLVAGEARLALTLVLTGLFIATAAINVRAAIPAVFVYAILLGDLRRLLMPFVGWSGTDPLLLVGGVFALVVTAQALAVGAVRFDTRLAKWVAALVVIMALQIFNPRQGGLMVGVAGALFMLVPLFWFWVGRTYATPALLRVLLLKVVLPFAVVAAAYGTYQVFFGYLPHQQLWLEMNWYAGLGSPDNPSPISLFASNTEYGTFLAVAAVVSWAAFLKGSRAALALVALFLVAIVLTGIRGPLFFALVMMAALWAMTGRTVATWVARGALALAIAFGGLAWGLTQASQFDLAGSAASRIERQTDEFVDARTGASEYSSIEVHLRMMGGGYGYAVSEPLGLGLGAVTKAAGKFGGRGHSTETALGNSFVALGLPGGVVYHVVIALLVIAAFQFWIRTRSLIALALFGVLGVTMADLLAGGLYAVGPLVAFCAGAVDRLNEDAAPKTEAKA